MREQEHNYEVYSLPYGFKVTPRDNRRPETFCTVDENGFWTIKLEGGGNSVPFVGAFGFTKKYGQLLELDDFHTPLVNKWNNHLPQYPLYNFYSIVDNVVKSLYRSYERPLSKRLETDYLNPHINNWMHKQSARALNRPIHDEWKRVVEGFNPVKRDIHRKLFSIAVSKHGYTNGNWDNLKEILRESNPYFLSDIKNYRATGISVLYDYKNKWKEDWAYSFSSTGNKYRTLMRTIMNIPGGIYYPQVVDLNNVLLSEPILTRIRMIAYNTLISKSFNGTESEAYMRVVRKSSHDELRNAVKMVWYHSPTSATKDFRNTSEIYRAFRYIFDYPHDIGDWNIVGLATRSVEYHQNIERHNAILREKEEKENEEFMKSNVALPPIPLPSDDGVKFLDTVKSIFDEGDTMKHCISGYAQGAHRGHHYLFHVDYKGEMASVQVSARDGRVIQSHGIRNQENEASKHGQIILGQWGTKLPKNNVVPDNPYVDLLF